MTKMNKIIRSLSVGSIFLLAAPLLFTGCTSTGGSSSRVPEVSFDGLVLQDNNQRGNVWVAPDADFTVFKRVGIMQPEISFRTHWQSEANRSRGTDRVSNRDMENMIQRGQELFMEQFRQELANAGIEVSDTTGDDVLLLRPRIINVSVNAPDPNNLNGVWRRVYTDGAGSATLVLELFDSMSLQILARAVDTRTDSGRSANWMIPRSQATNVNDARAAARAWARMFVTGFENARSIYLPQETTE
jgi:hypothetical protein